MTVHPASSPFRCHLSTAIAAVAAAATAAVAADCFFRQIRDASLAVVDCSCDGV